MKRSGTYSKSAISRSAYGVSQRERTNSIASEAEETEMRYVGKGFMPEGSQQTVFSRGDFASDHFQSADGFYPAALSNLCSQLSRSSLVTASSDAICVHLCAATIRFCLNSGSEVPAASSKHRLACSAYALRSSGM